MHWLINDFILHLSYIFLANDAFDQLPLYLPMSELRCAMKIKSLMRHNFTCIFYFSVFTLTTNSSKTKGYNLKKTFVLFVGRSFLPLQTV